MKPLVCHLARSKLATPKGYRSYNPMTCDDDATNELCFASSSFDGAFNP